jgi:hypothetical protein
MQSFSAHACYMFYSSLILQFCFGEEHKLWSSTLCSFLEPPVISSFLCLNFLLSTLFPDTPRPWSSFNVRDQVSRSYRSTIYKAILKPIWTYGIQLRGTTSNSNIEILERFQSKVLRLIVDAPWYVLNSVIRKDLQIPTVKEEISRFSSHYDVRLRAHTNKLITPLTEPPIHKRLRR